MDLATCHVSHESRDYLIRHADAMTALALGNATALASAPGAYVQASGAMTAGAVTAASFLQELAVPPVARQEPAAPRAVRATRRMDTGEDSKQALEARVHEAGAALPVGSHAERVICRSGMATDLRSTLRHELRSTAASEEMVSALTQTLTLGVVDAFVKFATVTLPNIFMDALVDILCDLIVYALVFAVVGSVSGPAARDITDAIVSEVEFSFPPSFTVYMTSIISKRLSNMAVGYISRVMARYIDEQTMPRVNEVTNDQLATTLSTEVANSVLDTLPPALGETLSHSLTHALPHYYYCSYCFYYGDYCQYCFYFRDYQWAQRMWWAGSREPTKDETTSQIGPHPIYNLDPAVSRYHDGLGHAPDSRLNPTPGEAPPSPPAKKNKKPLIEAAPGAEVAGETMVEEISKT